MFLLTVSIFECHKKGQASWFIWVKTQLGGVITLARYNSFHYAKTFIIKPFPITDNERDFHKLRAFSSLLILICQLSSSTGTVPKTTPTIFIFRTQVSPRGSSDLLRHAPSHMASGLERLSFAPEPFRKQKIYIE